MQPLSADGGVPCRLVDLLSQDLAVLYFRDPVDSGPGPNVASAFTGFVGPIHMKRDEKDCRVSGNGYEASQCWLEISFFLRST